MCGIMGYYCFGDKKPDKQQITEMFSLLESRGRDASGYALIKDNELYVYKAAVKSSVLVQSDKWNKLELPRLFIAHSRMKTQGSEKNNANNHPLFNKAGLCIVHNGMIHNDNAIFAKNKRYAEVDSEAILAVLSATGKHDKIKCVFDQLEGSFSFALIDKNNPERLVLVKKDNPLELYYDLDLDILYFCSEREIMKEALNIKSISQRGFNIGESCFHFYSMENNHCLIVDKEGVQSYKQYKSRYGFLGYRNYHSYENHSGESYEYEDEQIIECPWCTGRTTFSSDNSMNRCQCCGMRLNEEDLYV